MTFIVEIKPSRSIYRRRGPFRTPEELKAIRALAQAKAAATHKAKNMSWKEDKPTAVPKFKPNPIAIALSTLQARLVEHASCDGIAWFLDGRPANLDKIMIETNIVRKKWNLPQIDVCERWRVE
jgi:hypothetical protein